MLKYKLLCDIIKKTKKKGIIMLKNEASIENRIRGMRKVYENLDTVIDSLGVSIPEQYLSKIKKLISGDEQLKELMEGIDTARPPRILMVGRTGVGKSSLVNALCSAYTAPVSDVKSCTTGSSTYECKDNGRVLMYIMDSRGIAESKAIDAGTTAEEQLLEEISKFEPDAVLFVLPANARDNINNDAKFLKKLKSEYCKKNQIELPVIVVLNKVDQLQPIQDIVPKDFPDEKLKNIKDAKDNVKVVLREAELQYTDIIEVSSNIGWVNADGDDVSPSDIIYMSESEVRNLQICFDGRYKIEELRESINEAMKDNRAKMGFRLAFKLDYVVKKLSKNIVNSFTAAASAVALTPIPVSDIFILLAIQSLMVSLIGMLSGREMDIKAAKEFIFSLGSIGAAGYGFKNSSSTSYKAP